MIIVDVAEVVAAGIFSQGGEGKLPVPGHAHYIILEGRGGG